MNCSHNDFYKDLCAIPELDRFWEGILVELSRFGCTSLSYSVIATHAELENGFRKNSILQKTNHTKKLFDEMGLDQLIDDCRNKNDCSRRMAPVFWHHVKQAKGVSGHVGFTISTTNFSPSHLGAISVRIGDLSGDEFDAVWSKHKGEFFQILSVLDRCMRKRHLSALIGLSPREEECLTWLAAGLRPGQIAHELKIGEGTVDKYIGWARKKLKAGTRDQAVAKAIIFKVICP